MINTNVYTVPDQISRDEKNNIITFLLVHLEQYGDKKEDITKAFDYTMSSKGGGCVITAHKDKEMVGAVIINKTGMEGYIPENILVYIATHKEHRGEGIATALMKEAIGATEGNIALHVEHDNPAIGLYKKFGFTNKYLEMRLNKKEEVHGVRNA